MVRTWTPSRGVTRRLTVTAIATATLFAAGCGARAGDEPSAAGEGCAELDARMYVAVFVLTIAAMLLTSMLLIFIGRRSIPQFKRPSRDGTQMTSKYAEPLLS